MISRLTLSAVIFAIVGTASLAMAATVHQSTQAAQAAAKSVRVVQLDTVTVVAKRLPQAN
ncbi:MAG TPA: hypothetical protein VNU71_17575 [Burkholderiaceae bacterium]|nr:hypothetical protein [Burkholderiaceae bacterium]